MAGLLPFSLSLLIPLVGQGYSGRGAMTYLRKAGFAFTDVPFWAQWRTAASYKKYEWRATQLPTDEYVPGRLVHETATLTPGKRVWTFTTLERNTVTGEYRSVHTGTSSYTDATIEEAEMAIRGRPEEQQTYDPPWVFERLSFQGAWIGEPA